jgi:hypothetical protein
MQQCTILPCNNAPYSHAPLHHTPMHPYIILSCTSAPYSQAPLHHTFTQQCTLLPGSNAPYYHAPLHHTPMHSVIILSCTSAPYSPSTPSPHTRGRGRGGAPGRAEGGLRRRKQWTHIHRATRFPRSRSVRQREQWLATLGATHSPHNRSKTGLQLFEEPACSRESKDTLRYAVKAVVNSVSSRKPIQRSLRGASSQPA